MTQPDSAGDPCVFCKIVRGEIPAKRLLETAHTLIIADIAPHAPFHFLILPKIHARTLGDFVSRSGSSPGLVDLWTQATLFAEKEGLAAKGYRLVVNTGEEGGQTVPHLHIHLLAGRAMGWPPG